MKIVVRDSNSPLRIIASGHYATEQQLQDFLLESPDLIPLDEVDAGAMPLLTIGSEVPVASGWIDVLYLDAAGLLTVVETKLKRNPESKREVIGQIIEYAANLSEWSADEVVRQAERYLSAIPSANPVRLQDSMNALLHETVGEKENALILSELRDRIGQQLADGKIRLIIAVDEINEQLQRSVTFLNTFSSFELYLLQLVHFEDEGKREIFVPSLFGHVRKAQSVARSKIRWDEKRFFEALQRLSDESKIKTISDIYQFAVSAADSIWWGSSKKGSFSFHLIRGKDRVSVFTVLTTGELWINFALLQDKVGIDPTENLRQDLNQIPGLKLPSEGPGSKWPSLKLQLLSNEAAMAQFMKAIRQFGESIKAE